MIFFVAPREETFTMDDYLRREEGLEMAKSIRTLAYEDLFARPELPVGSYVFAALDQLTPTGNEIVARFRRALADVVPGIVLLNDPGTVLHRYELLERASATGRNSFHVTRAFTLAARPRFPVFLRPEREHTGSLTGLIATPRQLQRELLAASVRGYRLRDLLVVEYCDTADSAGIFRKYSAYIVGDRVIPRSINQSRHWVTKDHDRIIDDHTAQEELEYVTTNPHAAWLTDSFRLAGAQYGRVDYGLLNGTPQLWEVNLCPTVGRRLGPAFPSTRTDAQRALLAPARRHFYQRFQAALEDLDRPDDSRIVTVSIATSEMKRLLTEQRKLARVRSRNTIISAVLHPVARLLKRVASRQRLPGN